MARSVSKPTFSRFLSGFLGTTWGFCVLVLPNVFCALLSPELDGASAFKKAGFVGLSMVPIALANQFLPRRLLAWLGLPVAVLLPFELQLFLELGDGSSVGLIASAAASSAAETKEFLLQRWWLALAMPCSIFLWWHAAFRIPRPKGVRSAGIVALCLLVATADVCRKASLSNNAEQLLSLEESFAVRSWPTGIPFRIFSFLNMRKQSRDLADVRNGFSFHARADAALPQNLAAVIIIGESSRRANWSHYGYARSTTPLLSARPGLIWLEAVQAPANLTMNSVPQLVTRAIPDSFERSIQEASYLKAAREAGFRTAWVSTQWSSGGMVPELLAIVRDADTAINAEHRNGFGDERAVPELAALLRKPGRQFIVLHQHGSHSDYIQRSPLETKRFLPEGTLCSRSRQPIVNAYDNSIVETDHVLAATISALELSRRPSFLMYVSDHGENLLDDARHLRLHGSPFPSHWELEVPAFFWISPEMQRMFPGKVNAMEAHHLSFASFRNLSETVLDLSGIRSPLFSPHYSLASNAFIPGSPLVRLPSGGVQRHEPGSP